jgi:hypothetical protein
MLRDRVTMALLNPTEGEWTRFATLADAGGHLVVQRWTTTDASEFSRRSPPQPWVAATVLVWDGVREEHMLSSVHLKELLMKAQVLVTDEMNQLTAEAGFRWGRAGVASFCAGTDVADLHTMRAKLVEGVRRELARLRAETARLLDPTARDLMRWMDARSYTDESLAQYARSMACEVTAVSSRFRRRGLRSPSRLMSRIRLLRVLELDLCARLGDLDAHHALQVMTTQIDIASALRRNKELFAAGGRIRPLQSQLVREFSSS